MIDGKRGLGQPVALLAVEIATTKAKQTGTASVAVRNSTDIFMIGAYAERLARNGLVGIVLTSGPPLVHPYGGVERMLSTNPIAFGIPRQNEDPLVFDMATSALAASPIRQAAYYNEPLPPGTGSGRDGKPTTVAAEIRRGAISPLAGHKGFGLALCIA
ncbi:MAG: Ldh family oxidoreductase [Desulfobacterales bacterium]|nr:MAG: Ldh family oxidoreductase [Desulfobacterales bacterium]